MDFQTDLLYVADNGNNRIVRWGTDQLGWIVDMPFNTTDGSFILCDGGNRRVVRWSRRAQQGEILIDRLYCSGLAMDDHGALYIAEYENHRVSRWTFGENRTMEIVAGGQGKGSRLNPLDQPSGIVVDTNRTVYIGDSSNDRLVKWVSGSSDGILLGKLRWPKAIHVNRRISSSIDRATSSSPISARVESRSECMSLNEDPHEGKQLYWNKNT